MNKLHEAVKDGDLERCKQLIEDGFDVNTIDKWGNTPLYYVDETDDPDLYEYLKSAQKAWWQFW